MVDTKPQCMPALLLPKRGLSNQAESLARFWERAQQDGETGFVGCASGKTLHASYRTFNRVRTGLSPTT